MAFWITAALKTVVDFRSRKSKEMKRFAINSFFQSNVDTLPCWVSSANWIDWCQWHQALHLRRALSQIWTLMLTAFSHQLTPSHTPAHIQHQKLDIGSACKPSNPRQNQLTESKWMRLLTPKVNDHSSWNIKFVSNSISFVDYEGANSGKSIDLLNILLEPWSTTFAVDSTVMPHGMADDADRTKAVRNAQRITRR